jgi:pimeloyl-[acyl-carrier protein] methyl ester esterase
VADAVNAADMPAVVLLPGLDGTGKLFAEFVQHLRPNVDPMIISYPKDQPLGYDELEALVLAALPQDRPFVLLGESFSGPIAMRIGARSPAGLVAVILCGTFAKNPFPWLGWARCPPLDWWRSMDRIYCCRRVPPNARPPCSSSCAPLS